MTGESSLSMLRRSSNICLLLLSGWLLTGPLALLQLGAWAWMLASYSQESSLRQAIVETFGDERPCEMCRVIDAVKAAENDGSAIAPNDARDLKLMLGLARPIRLSVPTPAYEPKSLIVCEPENAWRAVPTPPPRVA